MTVNPLVAARVDEPKSSWAGIWIAEDIELIAQGVENRSWVDGTLGVVGAGLDALALVSDPVGALLQYGISWLIEHVKPLSEALDWLAGDPAQIAAHAQTWRNVASSLRAEADSLAQAVRFDLPDWRGAAADAYQGWAAQREQSLQALAKASDTMALITEGAGLIIGTVRIMVRDAVATVVSRLIVYAGELIATLGAATPVVAEQVTTLCASWAARIARWLKELISSIRNLLREGDKLGRLIEMLKRKLGIGGKGGDGLTSPSRPPSPNGKPRGDRTDAHPTRKKDRALRRENESADTLAQNGYDVEQNPPPKPNGKEPDYRIEGEYFDCYSPDTAKLDNIRDAISDKVRKGQANRIVLNLDDCPRSAEEIADVLRRKPITNLEQILVVKDGKVVPFYPFE
ncbi:hypothetical protein EV385_4115 [Krasilnikovia cinnamomea]|uniref:Uncharacterized protein n=1 Tax=Krasilnikovia cinnamomea TaxID=349313 RepID=A0A4Q7ZMN4_9ACTN|nr:hypothetical protein [Krasilnikovia cinnamomea]RZU52267.1 hypothetical protein EV385_4115 [Krasilnikovia cinnamomea]